MKATILRRRITGIVQALQSSSRATKLPRIDQSVVYKFPSIEAISDHLTSVGSLNGLDDPIEKRVSGIEQMIEKYTYGQPAILPQFVTPPFRLVVLLTGSTGNLGSEILEKLLRSTRVTKVYTLNRHSTSQAISERHLARFRDKGLDSALLASDKLVYVEGDLSKERLGISEELFSEVGVPSSSFEMSK